MKLITTLLLFAATGTAAATDHASSSRRRTAAIVTTATTATAGAFDETNDDLNVNIHESAFFKPPLHYGHSHQYNIRQFITAEQEEYFLSKTGDEKKKEEEKEKEKNYDIENQCQPRHVHLSLGNTNRNEKAAMTVSFSIPSTSNSTSTTSSNQYDTNTDTTKLTHSANVDDFCRPENINVFISYQRVDVDVDIDNSRGGGTRGSSGTTSSSRRTNLKQKQHPKEKSLIRIKVDEDETFTETDGYDDHDDGHENENEDDNNNHDFVTAFIKQYKVKSPLTNETYISDWIYHAQLTDLDYDSLYSYSIQVQAVVNNDNTYTNTNTNDHENENEIEKSNKDKVQVENDSNAFQTGKDVPQVPILKTMANKAISTFFDTSSLTNKERTLYNVMNTKHRLLTKKRQPQHQGQRDSEKIVGNTPQFTFHTPPSPLTSGTSKEKASIKPIKFAIVGDLGQTYNSSLTMLNILSETSTTNTSTTDSTPVSLMLCAGDMSYANSLQHQWDSWFSLIEPLISQTPLVVAAGNHEIECDMYTRLPFIPYENRFFMPNRIGPADLGPVNESYIHSRWGCATPSVFQGQYDYGNAFYSFTYGYIKTIVLSPYSQTKVGSPQYEFLLNELKSIDRTETPWVIVMMHTQFYTTFMGHHLEMQTMEMRQAMEPLFHDYGVNFVFSGHDHAYMRSKSMFNRTVVENGDAPVYLIVGEGGNREHHVKYYLHDEPEEWVAVRDKTVYGHGTLEFVNETLAHWKWIMDPNDEDLHFTDDVWLPNRYFLD